MDTAKICICLKNNEGRVVCEKKLTSLPIREEIILSKSVEFFGDPEPCMIHRSAVMKRLFFELGEYFEIQIKDGNTRFNYELIPQKLKDYLDIKEDVCFVEVRYI